MGLFGKGKVAEKVGNGTTINSYYIQFPQLEGSPTFEVEDALTVGSEVGDALLNSDALSPRHCTFYVNQDVLSVMDHNSTQGTFIGKRKIGPGRMIILQHKDKLRLGELAAVILVESRQVPMEPDFKRMDTPEEVSSEEKKKTTKEEKKAEKEKLKAEKERLKAEKAKEKARLKEEKAKAKNKGKKVKATGGAKGQFKVGVSSGVAFVSNAAVRLVAVLFDLLIASIIVSFATDVPELSELLAQIWPSLIEYWNLGLEQVKQLSGHDLKATLAGLLQSNGVLQTISQDVVTIFNDPQHQNTILILTLYAGLRLLFTLLCGVSLGQLLAGIRGHGNPLVKRLLGTVREFIGLFTGPLLIFDVLTVVSKPSLKEFLTMTRIVSIAPVKAALSVVASGLLLVSTYTLLPLMQGGEFLRPLPLVNDLSKGLSKKLLEGDQYFSEHFGAGFRQSMAENLIPSYTFIKKEGKSTVHLELVLLTDKTKLRIRPYKTFQWDQVLRAGLDMNPVTKYRFPDIDQVVYAAGNESSLFKSGIGDYQKYSKAVVALTNTALNLGLSTVLDYVKQFGPFLRSLADYRKQFMGLVPEGSTLTIVTNAADSAVFVFATPSKERFYLVPITYPKGTVYEIDTNQQEEQNMSAMLEMLYFAGPALGSLKAKRAQSGAAEFVDTIYQGLVGQENSTKLQQNYDWLYQRLTLLMTDKNEEQIAVWTASIKKLLQIMETSNLHKDKNKPAWNKFYRNLSDVLKALKDKDYSFFGIKNRRLA